MARFVLLLLLLAFRSAAGADAPEIRGMPEGATAGVKPDRLLRGGGINERDGGNASSGASRPASAQRGPFDAHDLDGDGFVSQAEAAGHGELVGKFSRADRNKDGRLTRAEFDNLDKPAPAAKKKRSVASRRQPERPSTAGTAPASNP